MSTDAGGAPGFDPDFDDAAWTEAWWGQPIALAPVTIHPSGYRVERQILHDADVFGRRYRLSAPFDCRLLFDPAGRLWMSNTPQEHMMMYNNAARSWGEVLVGGLGLGLYPQYAVMGAAGQATAFTIVEGSRVVRDIVGPVVRAALDVPCDVTVGDVESYLIRPVRRRYDTIFLDTWDTLDAANLPAVNRLRDLAVKHLAPGGRLLLWGYRWMVRLFEDACRQLLSIVPDERATQLAGWIRQGHQATLLLPVAERFAGQAIEPERMEEALAWCRAHVIGMRAS